MTGEQLLENVVEYFFSPLYQLAVVCAVIYFLWGMLVFIWFIRNGDDGNSTKRNEGKNHMLWGLVGLFIVLSVGGILKLANELLDGMFQF